MGEDRPQRVLSLFDTTNLIVGIIVGAGVVAAAPEVARGVSSGGALLGLWVAGGLLSLCGAVGYAELATAYPEDGGDYVYLTRAYGRWAGFLFGWIQTLVVRPGDIAVMAFVFATYAQPLLNRPWIGQTSLAVGAVTVLTVVNAVGLRGGVAVQNVLTLTKVAGIGMVVVLAAAASGRSTTEVVIEPAIVEPLPLSVALILVLFSYGGWNEMAYVAAEVRDPRRNIVRAMVTGMAVVIVIYVAINTAFLTALGLGGLAASEAAATEVVAHAAPNVAGPLVSVLICVCALGAVNGLVFAGARISYAVGRDHRILGVLGRWSASTGTPVRALAAQGALAVVLIVALGSFIDTVMYTAAAVYLFYLATAVALIVLRFRDRHVVRPYRVTGYPWTTLLFCVVCLLLVVAAVRYRPLTAVASVVVILLGMAAFRWSARFGTDRSIGVGRVDEPTASTSPTDARRSGGRGVGITGAELPAGRVAARAGASARDSTRYGMSTTVRSYEVCCVPRSTRPTATECRAARNTIGSDTS